MSQIIGLALLVGLLQACSAVKIFYNQAPDLAYWYLDGHFDLTGAQSPQVKNQLIKLQTWHRQTQLPAYVEVLQKLQQQLPADMDASAVCVVYADERRKLIAVSDRAQPAAAALVGTLTAAQLTHLERRFAKGNASYREDFLQGSTQERRDKRFNLDSAYRDYIDQLTRENCATFTALHRSTTAAQRKKAVEALAGYEQDFKALISP